MKIIAFRPDDHPRVAERTHQEQQAFCLVHDCIDNGMSCTDALNFVGSQPLFSDLLPTVSLGRRPDGTRSGSPARRPETKCRRNLTAGIARMPRRDGRSESRERSARPLT
jgi:hypothetical protein